MRSQVTGHRSQVTGLVFSIGYMCLVIFSSACTNTQNKSNTIYNTSYQYVCCFEQGQSKALYCPGDDCQACTGSDSSSCGADVLDPSNWFNQKVPFGSNCAQQNDGSYLCSGSFCSNASDCQNTCSAGCTPETTTAQADVTVQSSNGIAYCLKDSDTFCPNFTLSSDTNKASNCECLLQD